MTGPDSSVLGRHGSFVFQTPSRPPSPPQTHDGLLRVHRPRSRLPVFEIRRGRCGVVGEGLQQKGWPPPETETHRNPQDLEFWYVFDSEPSGLQVFILDVGGPRHQEPTGLSVKETNPSFVPETPSLVPTGVPLCPGLDETKESFRT